MITGGDVPSGMKKDPTNKVLYRITRKDGSKVEVVEGPLKDRSEVPKTGDEKWVNGIGCRVVAVASTPDGPDYTWQAVLVEH